MFTRMRGLRITLIVLASVAAVKSLSCPPCWNMEEPQRLRPQRLGPQGQLPSRQGPGPRRCKPVTCKGETTKDACGCCPKCAKMLNEECGGPWKVIGECNSNLQCNLQGAPMPGGFEQRNGICGLKVDLLFPVMTEAPITAGPTVMVTVTEAPTQVHIDPMVTEAPNTTKKYKNKGANKRRGRKYRKNQGLKRWLQRRRQTKNVPAEE